jgi:hypothetical protein
VSQESSLFFLGGLSFRLTAAEHSMRLDAEEAYHSFLTADPGSPHPSETIEVRCRATDQPSYSGEAIFRSSATWSILARGRDRALEFRGPDGDVLYVAEFRPGSDRVAFNYSPRLLATQETAHALDQPLRYPLDQVLTMYLLNGVGVILHAAGALVCGQGVALAGVSGAGKSTFMRLATGRQEWQPLSDDRVILRLHDRRAMLHGTPWPGEGRVAVNRCGTLARLLFLEQARETDVRALAPKEALARLLRIASIPWYDPDYLGRALDACGRIVASAPSGVLTFRPDLDAVKAVERLLRM